MRLLPAVALAVLAALGPACGHRGDPLPPRRRAPPAPQGFRLAQRGEGLEVQAIAPTASVDGVAYETLMIEFLYAEGVQDLEKAGRRHRVPAVPGRRVVATLPLPAPGVTVRAAARAVTGKHEGQRTLPLALVARAPLEAPRELTAVLVEDGVALSWRGVRPKPAVLPAPEASGLGGQRPGPGAPTGAVAAPRPERAASAAAPGVAPAAPPAATPPGGEPAAEAETVLGGARTSGFFAYRRLGNEAFAAPLVEEPLEQRGLTDALVPRGTTACYVVRAVASTEPLVESAPSNEACVEVRDIAPPAPPAGLAVLPREGGLEILWSPSAEADLAGYRVYRAAPEGAPERIAEVEASHTAWLDGTPARGAVYRYAVTAVDQAGNESERSEPVEATLP